MCNLKCSAADQTDGVIEQVAESALQIVEALPGLFGTKVMDWLLVTSLDESAEVGELQAFCGGIGMVENCDTTAATAEFM